MSIVAKILKNYWPTEFKTNQKVHIS
jgi:hypothetical protein